MIEIKNLNMHLGNKNVKCNETLCFYPGKVHFIKGPSGAGKTTFLYILGLVSSQKDYEYCYFQKKVDSLAYKERIRKSDIGMLYQNFNTQDHLSLYQNMKLFADLNGQKMTRKRAKEILNLVELKMSLNRYPKSLSGGEKQRFCLACILAKNPKVIIADEPTSALDDRNAKIIMQIFKQLALLENKIVIISTHTNQFDDLADYIDTISSNKIQRISKAVPPLKKETRTVKKKKLNWNFYAEMVKHHLYLFFNENGVIMLLTLMMMACSGYLILFGKESQNAYEIMLNSMMNNEVFLIAESQDRYTEEDLKKIMQMDSVVNVYPMQEAKKMKIKIDNQTEKENVTIYPIYDFQKMDRNHQGVYGDASMRKYIDSNLELENGQVFKLEGVIGAKQLEMYEARGRSLFIPIKEFEKLDSFKKNNYVIEIDNFDHLSDLKTQIKQIGKDYRVASIYSDAQAISASTQTNAHFIKGSILILNVIAFLLLSFLHFQEIINRQKTLCVFQANGLSRKELIIMEIMETIGKYIIGLFIIVILSFVIMKVGNAWLLPGAFAVKMNLNFLMLLMLLLLIDDVFPSLISIFMVLQISPEKQLRANL